MTERPEFISVQEAADIIGVAYGTVLTYIHRNNDPLPAGRTGTAKNAPYRISVGDIEEWLRSLHSRTRGEKANKDGSEKTVDPVVTALERVRKRSGRRR